MNPAISIDSLKYQVYDELLLDEFTLDFSVASCGFCKS